MKRSLTYILGTSFLVITAFFVGSYFGQGKMQCEVCQPQDIQFSLFWETYNTLKGRYLDQEKIDDTEILYGAISGMVNSLEDPYTVFMKPDNSKKFMEDISGAFEGVGMEIGIRDEILTVIAPLDGTPAQKAGLRSGDRILAVDEESTSGLSIDELVSKIRGPKGSVVVLTIMRDEWEGSQDFSISRGKIEVPSLVWERYDLNGEPSEKGTVAYLRIYHFTERVGLEFLKAATEIYLSDIDRIVLDLRNNPGGYLEMAQRIAGFFLERGEVVVIEDKGDSRQELKAKGDGWFREYPVVVIINEGSASASEILAGALKENREDVQLVGMKSFGKGTVQEMKGFNDGSSLKITIAQWLTPEGNTIHEEGLQPDVEIDFTEEDFEAGIDPQLQEAIELLK